MVVVVEMKHPRLIAKAGALTFIVENYVLSLLWENILQLTEKANSF